MSPQPCVVATGVVTVARMASHMSHEQQVANARLIEKCVNLHDELVAACRTLLAQESMDDILEATDLARDVLAKARLKGADDETVG